MLLLLVLLVPFAWIALAGYVGLRTHRRLVRVKPRGIALSYAWLTALGFGALPLWDLAPGLALYRHAVAEIGGIRIHRTAEVEGFLDRTGFCNVSECWSRMTRQGYRYLEAELDRSPPGVAPLHPEHGFYEFSFAPHGSESCALLEQSSRGRDLGARHEASGCLVRVRRDRPVSRYEFVIRRAVPYVRWFPFVTLNEETVRDLETGEVLAEAYQVRYVPWLLSGIDVPVLVHDRDEGRRAHLEIERVLVPAE